MVNIKSLFETYQVLRLMNNKLKFKIAQEKAENNESEYLKYEELQVRVKECLDKLVDCDIQMIEEIQAISKRQWELYLEFKQIVGGRERVFKI